MGSDMSKSERDKKKTELNDIIKFLEEEVKMWSDDIKNLKESYSKGQTEWIPSYLYCRLEETETRWKNIRERFPKKPVSMQPGPMNYPLTKTSDRREEITNTSKQIHQLETENVNLKKRLEQYEKGRERTERASNYSCSSQQDTVESGKDHKSSDGTAVYDKDKIISHLKEQLIEKEETMQKQAKEMEEQMNLVSLQKQKLEKSLKDAEKQIDEQNLRLTKDKDTSGKNGSNLRNDSNKKKSKVDQKGDALQSLQKQMKDAEENFKIEKLKMIEHEQVLTAEKESLETQALELQKEKDVLLSRLSKIAGDRLVDNNPAVADLSDPNRPTKLGEFYSELYDNEWTDAFEALKAAGHEEETVIETLRLTLENVVLFCGSKAELVVQKSTDAVNLLFEEYRKSVTNKKLPSHLTMPLKQGREIGKMMREKSSIEDVVLQQRWKSKSTNTGDGNSPIRKSSVKEQREDKPRVDVESKLKQLRKEMATSMIPIVQRAYIEASWTNDCIDELKPYILKCLYLGWMMVVQSPPMVLHKYPCDQEIKFDKNVYKEYTASGPVVRYVVWPALFLNESGPVVCKGVAEGKK